MEEYNKAIQGQRKKVTILMNKPRNSKVYEKVGSKAYINKYLTKGFY
jgi:hypothetical protein